jgi:hypothetical protein
MIGPGGLLLIVPHSFAVSVLWAGLQKSRYLNLDVNFFRKGYTFFFCDVTPLVSRGFY